MAVGESPLLHVTDSVSGRRFLVDTGAQVSVVPYSSSRSLSAFLIAADGRRLPSWSAVRLRLELQPAFSGEFSFIRAKVTTPILGADFLRETGLCVDIGC